MQTSYSHDMAVGFAGMVADNGPKDVLSRVNPDVAIPYGLAVCAGTDPDRDVKLPTTAAEVAAALGVAISTQSIESSSSGDPQYPVKSDVPVAPKVRVWVKVEDAVTPASKVFVRFNDGNGGLTQKGSFRSDADEVATVATAAELAGAKFRTSAAAGGLAVLELNLP